MAIKFGDILQNQNSAYPIVDGSNNDLKGVLFSSGLPGTTSFPNKRALGTILVDTTNNKLYLYIGADLLDSTWGNSASWSEMAQGSGETIQTSDIAVSIPNGLSFGRFENGDTISVGAGKSAVQIILDALTSYIAPTGAFSGSETAVQYQTTSQNISHTVTFSVTNQNQAVVAGTAADSAYAIREIKLWRRLGSGTYTEVANATTSGTDFNSGTFDDLNTQGSVTAETFTFNDTITVASGSADYNYKVEIIPNDGDGVVTTSVDVIGTDNTSGYIDCAAYSAPALNSDSHSRQDISSHFVGTAETNTIREKGNIATKLSFKVKCNSPGVPVTGFNVRRSINGGAATNIISVTGLNLTGTSSTYQIFDSVSSSANNVTGLNTGVAGYTNVTSAYPANQINADTISYTIAIIDGETTTTDTFATGTINLEFPAIVGYSTTDGSAFTASDNATMTSVLHSIRDTTADRRQYEIINTSGTGDPDFGPGIVLAPSGTQFVYIAFPATYSEIDTFQKPNTPDEYGSFGSDPKSISVSFTSKYGITNTAYEVYCSNSAGAFDGTYTIN